MPPSGAGSPGPTRLGPALKRLRRLAGIKQSHVAELAGVTQATVSRWESGAHLPDERQAERLLRLLEARLDGRADRALKRLVETSDRPVHLVCDVTHTFLAASPAREREWRRAAAAYRGERMFRFATEEIRAAEAMLPEIGWFEPLGPPVLLWNSLNELPEIRMLPGLMVWERVRLADGGVARLCTKLLPGEVAHLAPDAVVAVPPPADSPAL